MTHEQFRELLPLYVVGGLDGDELLQFERYVAANRSECEVEIPEWQDCADQLAFAAPAAQPSPAVLERILAQIDGSQPVLPSVRQLRLPEPERLDWRSMLLGWIPWTATAVLCVLLLGAALTRREALRRLEDQAADAAQQRAVLMQQNKRITELSAALEDRTKALALQEQLRRDIETLKAGNQKLAGEKAELMRTAEELRKRIAQQDLEVASFRKDLEEQRARLPLLTDPAIRVAQMADPTGASKATAKTYWQGTKKTGLVIVANVMPVVKGQGKCLELWAFCGEEPPVPAGLFWTDNTGNGVGEIKLAKEMACVSKFAVSVEPAAGVPAPTGPVVLVGH